MIFLLILCRERYFYLTQTRRNILFWWPPIWIQNRLWLWGRWKLPPRWGIYKRFQLRYTLHLLFTSSNYLKFNKNFKDNYTDFHRRHSDFVNSDTYEAYIGSRIAVGMKVRRCFSHVNYLIGDTGIVVDVNRQGKGKCYLNVKVGVYSLLCDFKRLMLNLVVFSRLIGNWVALVGFHSVN